MADFAARKPGRTADLHTGTGEAQVGCQPSTHAIVKDRQMTALACHPLEYLGPLSIPCGTGLQKQRGGGPGGGHRCNASGGRVGAGWRRRANAGDAAAPPAGGVPRTAAAAEPPDALPAGGRPVPLRGFTPFA